ncbi:hypothetical protein [Serratia fonticola]|uniref:hypothetical protein n=1 Tax=Serratia fonticola TaxID=47917 RepID=UPI0027FEFEFE|nr:hypothetical protein [Serratia fonticola]MDQ7208486.1 hypothetical protein [Serratia fonticola]HBE9078601.1 hypothetical protein [Serratia fonticola]HBE9151693.1 hypothetical protein [Serratia fonticola]
MNNSMPQNKKSNRLALVDPAKLRKAQQTIKQFPGSWSWKICMHLAKQAYGIECKAPLPEVGDCIGNFECTYLREDTGDYAFSHKRKSSPINYCEYIPN